ncbi:MAG: acyl-CoA synthetase [Betaproteobacteria bacterium]
MTTQSAPLWRRQSERGSLALMWVLTRIALLFGRGAARALLPVICVYFIVFSGAARRASREYLARVLQRPARFGDVYRHYLCFATTILDRVFWLSGRLDDYALELHGIDVVESAMRAGDGCLLIGAHFGSFELTRVLAREVPDMPIDVLMHPHNARKVGAAIRAVAKAADRNVIALGERDTMLRVRDALRAGHGVGLLADRSMHATDLCSCDFLGAAAAFARGPFKLSAALPVPVILFHSVWLGARRYRVEFVPMALERNAAGRVDVDASVRSYARWLESACRGAPYNWFNFYDFWADADASP